MASARFSTLKREGSLPPGPLLTVARDHAGLALAIMVCLVAFGRDLTIPLSGPDVWPQLLSTRPNGPGALLALFAQPLMAGTNFPTQVAQFYHPLTALTFAADQALFGLNPVGFHATNLLVHLVLVAATYALGMYGGISRWSAAAAALIAGIYPLAEATVPSLPRRQDLLAGALLAMSMVFLLHAAQPPASRSLKAYGTALVLFALALLSKEIAYAGLLLAPMVASVGVAQNRCTLGRGTLRRVLLFSLPFLAVGGLAFAIRWAVVGGLGGYPGTDELRSRTDYRFELFVAPALRFLFWPGRQWLQSARVVAAAIALLVAAVVLAWPGFPRRQRWLLALAVCWPATFVLLYTLLRTSTGGYGLYSALPGVALLLATLTECGFRTLAATRRGVHSALSAARPISGAALGLAGGVAMLATLLDSPLVTPYPEWRDAGSISQSFLSQALPCLAFVQPRGTAYLVGLPRGVQYATPQSELLNAAIFEPFSVESVLRLLAPTTDIDLTVGNPSDITRPADQVAVSCSPRGTGHVRLDVTAPPS